MPLFGARSPSHLRKIEHLAQISELYWGLNTLFLYSLSPSIMAVHVDEEDPFLLLSPFGAEGAEIFFGILRQVFLDFLRKTDDFEY